MKFCYLLFISFLSLSLFSQVENKVESNTIKMNSLIIDHSKDQPKATISQYRIITLERDTTFVDTSLTIKKRIRIQLPPKRYFWVNAFCQ